MSFNLVQNLYDIHLRHVITTNTYVVKRKIQLKPFFDENIKSDIDGYESPKFASPKIFVKLMIGRNIDLTVLD